MKRNIQTLLIFAILLMVSACVEKTGYYTEDENERISLICDVTWVGEEMEDGEDMVQSMYKFEKDGTYTWTLIRTDKDGKENRIINKRRWSFYDETSKTIYFGDHHYWDIEVLNAQKFEVYDRSGEYGQNHMSREYVKFTPLDNEDDNIN